VFSLSQVLKYLDYVFTGVFTFEMVIKVRRRNSNSCEECSSRCKLPLDI